MIEPDKTGYTADQELGNLELWGVRLLELVEKKHKETLTLPCPTFAGVRKFGLGLVQNL